MAYEARAHVTWMSVLIMVAVTSSCITWLIMPREKNIRARTIKSISEADIARVPAFTAHCLFKVNNTFTNANYLAWVKVSEKLCANHVSLDDGKMWIKVEKQGVYLVYVQLTYSLQENANSNVSAVDLELNVEFKYDEGSEEFTSAYDTRQLTKDEKEANLSAFLLFNMKAGNKLSISAHPTERIKYNDIRPFSSYITIIRYADW